MIPCLHRREFQFHVPSAKFATNSLSHVLKLLGTFGQTNETVETIRFVESQHVREQNKSHVHDY